MGGKLNSYNPSERIVVNPGDRFGILTVLSEGERLRLPSGQINRTLICRCDCGAEKQIRFVHLRNERIKSCGCIAGERHGMCKSKLYGVWRQINERCSQDYNTHKHRYKDRGIRVCSEWATSFTAFYTWAIFNGYKEGLQIDRRNNNGNYEPSNCHFTTRLINVNNREVTMMVQYHGWLLPIMPLLRMIDRDTDYNTIRNRISRGWTPTKAIEKPIRVGNYGKAR